MRPVDRPLPDLRPGRFLDETELAAHAARLLEAHGLTQSEAAAVLSEDGPPVTRQAMHMALHPERWPSHGRSLRRRILAHFGGRVVTRPVYSRVLFDAEADRATDPGAK
jgi:hypothetical protein